MAKKYDYKSLYKDYMTQYNKSAGKAGTAAELPQTIDEFKMNFVSIKNEIKENNYHRLSDDPLYTISLCQYKTVLLQYFLDYLHHD